MLARFHDGLTTAAHGVEIGRDSDDLVFRIGDASHVWPLGRLIVERVGEQVRLSRDGDPARLVLSAVDWRVLSPGPHRAWWQGPEARLVAGLTAGAAIVGASLFFGIPMAAKPLARWTPPRFEQQMGESFDAQLSLGFKPCGGEAGQRALRRLGARLEDRADTPFDIRVRAVEAPMANAFALPGGAIVVTDDLIEMARSPDELAAVVAHEVAHVEKRHVMQAVWRSLGLGMLLDAVVGGGTGAGQQAVLLVGSVTDLRYGREAESEADVRGQQLLVAEGLSSEGMAAFFDRLAATDQGPGAAQVQELISSHPDTQRRARLSRARGRPGLPAMSPADWASVRAACTASDKGLQLPDFRSKTGK